MSNPNKSKSTLSFDKSSETAPVVTESAPVVTIDTPVEIAKDEFVSIAGLASSGRDKLIGALRNHMEKSKVDAYVPPAPTARQLSQTELEMAAGRRASERHAAQAANRPQPPRDPSDGYTTPVYRPGDHVPNLNSGDLGARNVK